MFSIANAMGKVAGMLDEPYTGGLLTSPQRHSAAIEKLEDDEDLSDHEQVEAISIFSRNTHIADSYLAIKKKSIRTSFIQAEILRNSS